MTTEFNNSAVIEKIKKLLALANDGGATEEEAATAASMASALAIKYSMDLAKIQLSGQPTAKEGVEDQTVYESDKYEPWIASLIHGLVALNGGTFYFSNWGSSVHYRVIGKPTALAVIRLMIPYLVKSVKRLNTEAVKRYGFTMDQRRAFRAGFRQSCAFRLYERMGEKAEEMRTKDDVAQKTTGSTALVVLNHFEQDARDIQVWMEQQGYKFKTRSAKARKAIKQEGAMGMHEGRKAGDRIGLDPQVSGSSGAKGRFSSK